MKKSVNLEKPDMILHLGDHESDAAVLQKNFTRIPLMRVKGNCDAYSSQREWILLNAGGKKVFMTHGHIYRVKWGIQSAVYAALEKGADVLLFGHTHTALTDWYDGLHIMNPGAAGRTYGILEINGENISCTVKNVPDLNSQL